MNLDPIRSNLDDDPTVAGSAPGLDVVESMAMEALASSIPIPADVRTATAGCVEQSPSDPEPTEADGDDPMIGQRVGPYELTARIGGGSMGTVYRATRVEDFRQEVAVTLIRRGRDSDTIVRRFQAEGRAQAALGKHPHIAGLLDAGTTEDGRPYVVTEYVDGRRIDEFCDDRRLDIPGRLRVFRKVCDAVHFAHRHMMIHRDLKPGHILIDGRRSAEAHRFRDRRADPSRAGPDAGVRQP